MSVDVEVLSKSFTPLLIAEIERVKAGRRSGWNDEGTFTKLLLEEARQLTYRLAAGWLQPDPDKVLEYLTQFPEALQALGYQSQGTLAEVIARTVEGCLADRLFTDEHRKIVIDQWNDVGLDDLMSFVEEFACKLEIITVIDVSKFDGVESVEDLKRLQSLLRMMKSTARNKDDPATFADIERRDEEYQEFVDYIISGDIDLEELKARRGATPAI